LVLVASNKVAKVLSPISGERTIKTYSVFVGWSEKAAAHKVAGSEDQPVDS
jgi:hypothetical protein